MVVSVPKTTMTKPMFFTGCKLQPVIPILLPGLEPASGNPLLHTNSGHWKDLPLSDAGKRESARPVCRLHPVSVHGLFPIRLSPQAIGLSHKQINRWANLPATETK